jgi:uncharacterized membrane protein YfcA
MLLTISFFVTALLYACVGFGGGSTYNALLILADTDYQVLPLVALSCNIIVVSGGIYHFSSAGHIKIPQILPWIILSIPAAWLGGYVHVSQILFTALLGSALFLSAVKMIWPESDMPFKNSYQRHPLLERSFVPLLVGTALGFVAGMTGIGGGIFLAPVLHMLRWKDPKNIAGTCSLFILVNSCAGLIGQLMKLDDAKTSLMLIIIDYWYLLPAVFIGGQIGSWLGAFRINVYAVKMLTGGLILYVSLRLLYRLILMV